MQDLGDAARVALEHLQRDRPLAAARERPDRGQEKRDRPLAWQSASVAKCRREAIAVRKQHHFRRIEGGLGVWDVERLIELSKGLTPKEAVRRRREAAGG